MINLLSELHFSSSRSSGPGGQNVNKVNTRVTVRFAIESSTILTEEQKQTIQHKLQNRINKEGELMVSCEETRSQLKNKEIAINLIHQLITNALKPVAVRKKTKPGKMAKLKRLQNKKIQGLKKANRQKPEW